MDKKQILNALKQNKTSILAFLVGYLMFVTNFKQVDAIADLINLMPRWFQIVSSVFFIFLSYFIIKVQIGVYRDHAILKNDRPARKVWKALVIVSIGALVGFLTNILQAYTVVLLGGIAL